MTIIQAIDRDMAEAESRGQFPREIRLSPSAYAEVLKELGIEAKRLDLLLGMHVVVDGGLPLTGMDWAFAQADNSESPWYHRTEDLEILPGSLPVTSPEES